MDRKAIAETITNLRKSRNLSRDECASACGISLSAWQMYENGERMPRDQIKVAIAELFNMPVGDIFFK